MEEVDAIIIDSLLSIKCDLEENIKHLKDFSPDLAFTSIVECLKAINPNLKMSNKLPPTMSVRLKVASNIADQIKQLGYKGDMGYQTILYSNEIELRRLLMFLIERIPTKAKTDVKNAEEEGYVPKLIKRIEEKIQKSLTTIWVPHELLNYKGDEKCSIRQNYGNCYPLKSEFITFPKTEEPSSDAQKKYWIHNLDPVNEQCSNFNLIPSLLFHDSHFTRENLLIATNAPLKNIIEEKDFQKSLTLESNTEPKNLQFETNIVEINLEDILEEIKKLSLGKNKIEEEIKLAQLKLSSLVEKLSLEEESLKELESKTQLKKKTLSVLSKQENLQKLKRIVEGGSDRLVDLANQWNSVQEPLLQNYKFLLNSQSDQESKVEEEFGILKRTQEKVKDLSRRIAEKEKLEKELAIEYKNINKTVSRNSITKRIIEIIGSVKKQDETIRKILEDTRMLQKELNNLNGQLERSFTLADELIYRDAKRDETARKAYKLLATLHKDCGQIIETVSELGIIEREARNLQDQIDIETNREIVSKLERVLKDLSEVRRENEILKTKIVD